MNTAADALAAHLTATRRHLNDLDDLLRKIKAAQGDADDFAALALKAGVPEGRNLRRIAADVAAHNTDVLGQLDGAGEALAGQRDALVTLLKAAGMDIR